MPDDPETTEPTEVPTESSTSSQGDRSAEIQALADLDLEKQAHAHTAATMAAETEGLRSQLEEARAQAQTARAQVAQAHRGMVLARNPDVVPDLVQGATPEEIDASIEAARAAYQHVAEAVRAERPPLPNVPVGASPRTETPPEDLSPIAKITQALSRNNR